MKFFCNTKRTDTVQFKYTKIRSLKNYFVIITDFAQIQIFLFTQKKSVTQKIQSVNAFNISYAQ